SSREISLAHKRLSIVDLSNEAAQPMGLPDGSIWVVFNGEIYNHAEIRTELEQKGHRFRTSHSDTEVILHAYQEWGIQCIERFRGMFAIGLWDQPKDLFYLVRDRIGIKPLYYTYQNGCCYFASEIKAILQDRSIPRKLNFQSAYDYLTFLTVPAPNTFFEGIQKLPAGHYIEIKNGQPSQPKEYWDVFTHVNYQPHVSEKEVTETLVEKLRESVKYRMMADVPVGVFLSGGIDSSVNAKLFSDLSNGQPVKAFSIGYENDQDLSSYTNEFYYARKVAKELGCEYYERSLNQQDLIDFLPQLVHHQDEPIADPVCMPIYYVSKLARDNGVIVAQVGEGSDELFWGYRFWKDLLKIQEYDDLPVP
ncbi:MAG: asparagine synthase (glutamine-hydrolyzing), partial [Bacteroidia bacterium]